MINRPFRVARLALAFTVFTAGIALSAMAADARIGITAIVDHPALDAARKGIVDELADAGYAAGKNLRIDYQSAQGNTATAAQIARKFAGDRPDVIVAMSTPSAQTAVAATRETPIVFGR